MVMRRDTLEKQEYALGDVNAILDLLKVVQSNMLEKSRKMRDSRIKEADSIEGILQAVENKNFVKAPWCGCRECEDKIKEQTQATSRIISEDSAENKVCAVCGKKAEKVVVYARAY